MDDQIWEWLDGQSSPAQSQQLQQLISTDAAWAARHAELLALHQSLQTDLEVLQPSMRFSKNVMEQIAALGLQHTARSYLNNRIIYGLGGLFVAAISAIILYAIAMVDWAAGSESSLQLPGAQAGSQIDWGGLVSGPVGTGAVVVFSVLALALADQYLRGRLQKRHGTS